MAAASKPISWQKISLWSRIVLSFVTLALLLDDLQAFVASGREPEFIAVFGIAYVTVILTIWLPKWSWAFVAAVVAASAFVAILAPVLFVVVAAGYALPMIGARRQAALLGLGIPGAVFLGMISGRFPRALWWTVPVVFLVSLGVGAVAALARDSMARFAARTEGLTNAEDELRLQERARIATDLHDGLGQSLAPISLTAGAAEGSQSVDELHEALGATAMFARDAREQMHELAQALAPLWQADCLDSAGIPVPSLLLAHVQGELESVGRPLLVQNADQLDQLAPTARELCCRVLREGITNVLRHAGPGRVEITLDETDSGSSLAMISSLRRPECEPPNVAAGRGLAGLTRAAAEQGALLTAGPIDGRWRLTLVLRGRQIVGCGAAADALSLFRKAENECAVGADCIRLYRFEPVGRAVS